MRFFVRFFRQTILLQNIDLFRIFSEATKFYDRLAKTSQVQHLRIFSTRSYLGPPWKHLGLPAPKCFQPLAFASNTCPLHQTHQSGGAYPQKQTWGVGGEKPRPGCERSHFLISSMTPQPGPGLLLEVYFGKKSAIVMTLTFSKKVRNLTQLFRLQKNGRFFSIALRKGLLFLGHRLHQAMLLQFVDLLSFFPTRRTCSCCAQVAPQ